MKAPLLLAMSALLAAGCARSRTYLADRGHDAADIMTCSVGIGAGAKARIGPVQLGLLAQIDVFGLRGGDAGCINVSWKYGGPVHDLEYVVGARDYFGNDAGLMQTVLTRNKEYGAVPMWGILRTPVDMCRGENMPLA